MVIFMFLKVANKVKNVVYMYLSTAVKWHLEILYSFINKITH